ncbi:MAG: hypothetical protein ACTSU5_12875 [Promethearchaeota archaeon]
MAENDTRESLPLIRVTINLMLFVVPVLYFMVLYLLSILKSQDGSISSQFGSGIWIGGVAACFVLLGVANLILTYSFFLPLFWSKYDPEHPGASFNGFFLTLTLSASISILGLILGILSWATSGGVYWFLFYPFLVVGQAHMFYVYLFRFPPELRPSYARGVRDRTPRTEVNRPLLVISAAMLFVAIVLLFVFLFPAYSSPFNRLV